MLMRINILIPLACNTLNTSNNIGFFNASGIIISEKALRYGMKHITLKRFSELRDQVYRSGVAFDHYKI